VRRPPRAALVVAWLAMASAACGILPVSRAPAECGYPDGTALAYAGRTTLRHLGLSTDLPAADLSAMVYVTAEPVPFSGSIPAGAAPPGDSREYCALFDDDAGTLSARGGVPLDWRPPGS
jgi:hypothetical protein